jgi:hypothetical protein
MELRLQAFDVETNDQIDNSDELLAWPVYGEIRRTGFLAQHVDAAIGERQHVSDFGIPHQKVGERLVEAQDLRLVQRNMELAGMTKFLDLDVRLGLSICLFHRKDRRCGQGERKDGVSQCAKHRSPPF